MPEVMLLMVELIVEMLDALVRTIAQAQVYALSLSEMRLCSAAVRLGSRRDPVLVAS